MIYQPENVMLQISDIHFHPMHTHDDYSYSQQMELGRALRRSRFKEWQVVGKNGTVYFTFRGNRKDAIRYGRRRLRKQFRNVRLVSG